MSQIQYWSTFGILLWPPPPFWANVPKFTFFFEGIPSSLAITTFYASSSFTSLRTNDFFTQVDVRLSNSLFLTPQILSILARFLPSTVRLSILAKNLTGNFLQATGLLANVHKWEATKVFRWQYPDRGAIMYLCVFDHKSKVAIING